MKNFLLGFLILALGSFAQAQTTIMKASIYAIGDTAKSPLFTQETEKTVVGDTLTLSSVIKDQTGLAVMREKATIKNGTVTSQEVEHLQINEKYVLELKDGRVIFLTYNIADGKMEEIDKADRKAPEGFLMGPSMEIFLSKNIEELKAKRSINRDFGVFELGRFISFKFLGISVTENKVEIKMRPANFFISMLVEPMKIVFDTSLNKTVYFKGRTPLRYQKNGSSKILDAEIIYH